MVVVSEVLLEVYEEWSVYVERERERDRVTICVLTRHWLAYRYAVVVR